MRSVRKFLVAAALFAGVAAGAYSVGWNRASEASQQANMDWRTAWADTLKANAVATEQAVHPPEPRYERDALYVSPRDMTELKQRLATGWEVEHTTQDKYGALYMLRRRIPTP